MAVLTQDTRFEDAYHDMEAEGGEKRNMCEVLDRVENRGIQKGIQQGIQQGEPRWRILEYIDIRREDRYTEEDIRRGIMQKFNLTQEQAECYMRGEIPE